MRLNRRLLGCLCAVLLVLPTAPLAWLLVRSGLFTGVAGFTGCLLALGGYRLGAGRFDALGFALAALLTPAAALPGMYYGCAELILQDNLRYGCTMEEALEAVPVVALDPINRDLLLGALGGLLALDLLTAILTAVWLRLKARESAAPARR